MWALQNSNSDKLIIINNRGEKFRGVKSLAKKNANAQKRAKKLGKIIIDNGIRYRCSASEKKNAEPIQYNPKENHPRPKNQLAKKVFFRQLKLLIKKTP